MDVTPLRECALEQGRCGFRQSRVVGKTMGRVMLSAVLSHGEDKSQEIYGQQHSMCGFCRDRAERCEEAKDQIMGFQGS
jgi:hypothetical protein